MSTLFLRGPKTLKSSLTPLFFSYLIIKSIRKFYKPDLHVYLESDHFSPPPSLLHWSKLPSSLIWIGCNSLLNDLPVSTPLFLNSLSPHRSHNVSVKTQSDRVTSALKILAQLAIYHRVKFRVLLTMSTRPDLIWSSLSL